MPATAEVRVQRRYCQAQGSRTLSSTITLEGTDDLLHSIDYLGMHNLRSSRISRHRSRGYQYQTFGESTAEIRNMDVSYLGTTLTFSKRSQYLVNIRELKSATISCSTEANLYIIGADIPL